MNPSGPETRKPPHTRGFPLNHANRGGGTRTPDLRFWRPPLYQLSYAPRTHGLYPGPIRDHGGVQRRALGALFGLLALALAGIAYESAHGAGGSAGRWIVAGAAAAIAVWLASLAWRALR